MKFIPKIGGAIVEGAVLALAAVVAVGVILPAARFALAAGSATANSTVQGPIVRIDATGKALVRGTLTSVTANTLTLTSWGGTWTANVTEATQILPDITGNDLAGFQAGDYVGVQGTAEQGDSSVIDATLVRDWTYRTAMTAEKKQNQATASQTIKSKTPKNYAGTVSDLSGVGFTLTSAGATTTTTFTVTVTDGAEVVNRNWIALPLPGISDGDAVRVWGIDTDGTIAGEIVRDLTVPATSTVPVATQPQ